jgi:hypothetical protein
MDKLQELGFRLDEVARLYTRRFEQGAQTLSLQLAMQRMESFDMRYRRIGYDLTRAASAADYHDPAFTKVKRCINEMWIVGPVAAE